MSVFINNGLSGLLAAQTALQTTANNVANAATDGYVRQRVELSERPSTVAAGASIGNGVSVNGVRRVYDQFVADEVKTAAMSEQRARQVNDLSSRLDKLLGNPEQGISQSVQAFFGRAEALSRDPTSTVNREQLLSEGQVLSDRFAQTEQQILRLGNEVDGRLQQDVSQINDLARSLSQINDRIAATANAVPNDLLDERERLLTDLSELIDFTTIRQQDGSVNVLVGNGQPLVLGVKPYELGLVPNEFDKSRLELAANGQPISGLIAGGEVAGLLTFRNENLDAATRQLGQLALGLTEVFNEQHRQGMDLNGDLGGDFFAGIQTTVIGSSNNTGSATVTLSVADPAAIEARDYILRYTGSAWELMDASSGAPVNMTGSGTIADPFIADGLSITTSAGAAAGDRFLVSAVRNAMSGVKLAISDTAKIAAASPVSTTASLSNLSDATISAATINDINDPNLLQGVDIVFDDATTYRLFDTGGNQIGGPFIYASGNDIDINGTTVQISGNVMQGDRFTLRPTGPGSGDNTNAVALAQVSSKGFFDNGRLSMENLGANVVASVGAAASRAEADLNIQTALRKQAELDLESISGVNLEEEAANMLRYQQAYLASSKIITVANDLFQTLLGATGR